MEIEAKFAVSDAETFQRLQAIDRLAGLPLSEGRVQRVRDTYLDTRDRRILAAGYACRRRERDDGILITVKSLQHPDGAVHRREEFETTLPSDQPPAEWSPSPARGLVLRVAGDAPLAPLCVIEQTRVARAISRDGQQIAELSLDDVRVDARDSSLAFFELEIELTEPDGADALAALVTCLQDEWKLQPEPRSKFERALDWLAAAPRVLTADERAVVTRIAQQTNSSSRRARALLALDDGATEIDAAARALGFGIGTAITLMNPARVVVGGGVSKSGERYWSELRAATRANTLPQMRVGIIPAALGDDAPLWGAIALAESI